MRSTLNVKDTKIIKLKPFVKWAGGKTQLLPELLKNKPRNYNRYIEPFVGGGALLFELKSKNALINDSNEELINCYIVIREKPNELIEELNKHKNEKEYFLGIRKLIPSQLSQVERAARLIYLNRTCFNGLWRVNKKNQFNTPFGNYKNPKIVNPPLLHSISEYLQEVVICSEDFEKFLMNNAKKGDFIYIDPPYHPISKYSDFKRYTKDFFGIEEQKRLANLFAKLDKKGCFVLLSNSYSDLILELFKDFKIDTVFAKRIINKDPNGRGNVKEVLVKNYDN
jgi:DNA adenine methylase